VLERSHRRFDRGPWVLARVFLLPIALTTTRPVDLLLREAQDKALVPFPALGAAASLVLKGTRLAYLRGKGRDEARSAARFHRNALPGRAGEGGGDPVVPLLDLEIGQAEMAGVRRFAP